MTDIVDQARELVGKTHMPMVVVEMLALLSAEVLNTRTDVFLLRGKVAELEAQIELQESGLGQPPGRHIGDDLRQEDACDNAPHFSSANGHLSGRFCSPGRLMLQHFLIDVTAFDVGARQVADTHQELSHYLPAGKFERLLKQFHPLVAVAAQNKSAVFGLFTGGDQNVNVFGVLRIKRDVHNNVFAVVVCPKRKVFGFHSHNLNLCFATPV